MPSVQYTNPPVVVRPTARRAASSGLVWCALKAQWPRSTPEATFPPQPSRTGSRDILTLTATSVEHCRTNWARMTPHAGERPDTARDDDGKICDGGNDQHVKQRHGLADASRRRTFSRLRSRCCPVAARSNAGLGLVIHEVYGQKNTLRRLLSARCTAPWRRPAMSSGAARLSAHQLRDQGSAAGNDRTGEQALSGGADARRQRLLQPSVGQDMRAARGGVLHRRQAAQESDERRARDPGSNWKS